MIQEIQAFKLAQIFRKALKQCRTLSKVNFLTKPQTASIKVRVITWVQSCMSCQQCAGRQAVERNISSSNDRAAQLSAFTGLPKAFSFSLEFFSPPSIQTIIHTDNIWNALMVDHLAESKLIHVAVWCPDDDACQMGRWANRKTVKCTKTVGWCSTVASSPINVDTSLTIDSQRNSE